MNHPKAQEIDALRARIARLQAGRSASRNPRALRFGLAEIDDHLPGNDLPDALHEVAGCGPEIEHGAAAALFIAGLLAAAKAPCCGSRNGPSFLRPRLPASVCRPRAWSMSRRAGMRRPRWKKVCVAEGWSAWSAKLWGVSR